VLPGSQLRRWTYECLLRALLYVYSMNRLDRPAGRFLHCQDVPSDLFGRLLGLHSDQFYFGSNDSEAPPLRSARGQILACFSLPWRDRLRAR